MFKRDDSMRSFRLEKATRPVGRPAKNNSFKLCKDVESFKICK